MGGPKTEGGIWVWIGLAIAIVAIVSFFSRYHAPNKQDVHPSPSVVTTTVNVPVSSKASK